MQQLSLNHIGPYHILGIGPQHLPSSLHFPLGRYKTWTLDSELDSGLDYGLDYGLKFGKSIPDLLFKEDFECWIAYDWPNSRNGHVCSF